MGNKEQPTWVTSAAKNSSTTTTITTTTTAIITATTIIITTTVNPPLTTASQRLASALLKIPSCPTGESFLRPPTAMLPARCAPQSLATRSRGHCRVVSESVEP